MREHPIRAAVVAAILGAAYIGAAYAQSNAHVAASDAARDAFITAVNGEMSDTLVIQQANGVQVFSGTLDTFSTSTYRVEFHADEAYQPQPPVLLPCHRTRCALGGGYDVTVYGPEGGYAASDCVFRSLDLLGGYSHVVMMCNF